MYKVDIPLDTKESAAIERRRNMEAARKSRIFNAKQRTIGVDVSALDDQVKETKEKKADEHRRHEAYAAQMIRNDTVAQLLDARNVRTRQQLERDQAAFREKEQRKESRREFDINDPNIVKNAQPLGQNPHGVSSLISFVGEDVSSTDRKKVQQEQIREWSLALQQESANARANMELSDQIYDLKRIQLDHKAIEMEKAEEQSRQENITMLKEFNQQLAEDQRIQREADRNNTLAENVTEIRNQIMGDMLTENPDVARSAFGPHRVIPDRWKGMNEGELREIRQTQEAQRLENIKKTDAEQELNAEWSEQQSAIAKAGILLEREKERHQKQQRRELDLINSELAKQQKQTRNLFDEEIYTNVPDSSYYQQFNTTTR